MGYVLHSMLLTARMTNRGSNSALSEAQQHKLYVLMLALLQTTKPTKINNYSIFHWQPLLSMGYSLDGLSLTTLARATVSELTLISSHCSPWLISVFSLVLLDGSMP